MGTEAPRQRGQGWSRDFADSSVVEKSSNGVCLSIALKPPSII